MVDFFLTLDLDFFADEGDGDEDSDASFVLDSNGSTTT